MSDLISSSTANAAVQFILSGLAAIILTNLVTLPVIWIMRLERKLGILAVIFYVQTVAVVIIAVLAMMNGTFAGIANAIVPVETCYNILGIVCL